MPRPASPERRRPVAPLLLALLLLAAAHSVAGASEAVPSASRAAPASRASAVAHRLPTSSVTSRGRAPRETSTSSAAPRPEGANARAWSFFPFPYWGPQGYIIGPPWFGAGYGGGNWRPIPNRTPFGPPGSFEDDLFARAMEPNSNVTCLFADAAAVAAAVAAADPFEPVEACSGFPCEVYTCRLGTNTTTRSTLAYYRDDAGATFARLRCFKLLDDFDETGCRQWDRLSLNRRRTDKPYDCLLPALEPGVPREDATPEWKNDIEKRRSELKCVGEATLQPARR